MIQRSRSDWSCIFLQIDVVCLSLSLSLCLEGITVSWWTLLENVASRTVRDRKQTYWQNFIFCAGRLFCEFVCAIDWNMIIKILSEKSLHGANVQHNRLSICKCSERYSLPTRGAQRKNVKNDNDLKTSPRRAAWKNSPENDSEQKEGTWVYNSPCLCVYVIF